MIVHQSDPQSAQESMTSTAEVLLPLVTAREFDLSTMPESDWHLKPEVEAEAFQRYSPHLKVTVDAPMDYVIVRR
jgi:hypothetical protein